MVKTHWDDEELIENWTLLPTELELVGNKVGANQIGFAILLKYFQLLLVFLLLQPRYQIVLFPILHNSFKFLPVFTQNITGKDALSAIIVHLSVNCLDFVPLQLLMERR